MRVRKKKSKVSFKKKLVFTGVAFLLLVIIITSFFGQKGLLEIFRARNRHKSLLQELEKLERTKARLEQEIDELENKPEAVELEARGELWLMKKDEKVIVKKSTSNEQ